MTTLTMNRSARVKITRPKRTQSTCVPGARPRDRRITLLHAARPNAEQHEARRRIGDEASALRAGGWAIHIIVVVVPIVAAEPPALRSVVGDTKRRR